MLFHSSHHQQTGFLLVFFSKRETRSRPLPATGNDPAWAVRTRQARRLRSLGLRPLRDPSSSATSCQPGNGAGLLSQRPKEHQCSQQPPRQAGGFQQHSLTSQGINRVPGKLCFELQRAGRILWEKTASAESWFHIVGTLRRQQRAGQSSGTPNHRQPSAASSQMHHARETLPPPHPFSEENHNQLLSTKDEMSPFFWTSSFIAVKLLGLTREGHQALEQQPHRTGRGQS